MAEFKFFCPQCGQQIQCDTSYSGTQIDCPVCKQSIVVPQPPRAASAVRPPVAAQARILRNVLVITATVVVLAGLGLVGWYGFSKIKMHIARGHLPPGLVSLWAGEGNARDSVGGNNGAGEKIRYAAGKIGHAFNFNGADFVQIPDAPNLRFTNAMTVEAWVNLKTFRGANGREIVSKFGGPYLNQASYTFSIDPATRKAYFIVNAYAGGTSTTVYSSTTIPTNQWVHLAGTYDGSTVKIYVNGQLSGEAPWTQGIFSGNNPLVIGCTLQNYSVPTSFFNGLIDEVGLFNRALSASEIQTIYRAE